MQFLRKYYKIPIYSRNNLWTKYVDSNNNYVIPYVISGPYGYDQYQTIYDVFQNIERNTCIRFERRTYEDNFIDIQNRYGEGCWSWIGRHQGRSVVKLEASNSENCLQYHTTMHEILHAVGLRHEHVRPDRDHFITIIYENIKPNCLYNFEKRNHQTFGLPYDYNSIMHYHKNMCQRRWGDITIAAPSQLMNMMGRSRDASVYDYYKVCAMYGCSSCLGRPFDLRSVLRAIRRRRQ